MERKCEKCGGLGGERWAYPDGSEGGARCDACDGFGYTEDGAVDETLRKARHFVAEAMMENGDPGFAKAVLAGGYDNGNSVKAVCKALSAFATQQPQYTAQQIAESFRAGQSTERMQPQGVPEGWVLVPVEPTDSILNNMHGRNLVYATDAELMEAWAEIIAAALSAEGQG